MPDFPDPETGPEPSTAPSGLVDPRVIHPGPRDDPHTPSIDESPGPEDAPDPGTSTSEDPEDQEGQPRPTTGMVDPRDGLPGPEIVALTDVDSIDLAQ
jgi:hypothetical protein